MFECFRWKTLNIKKEVPNVMQTWKNQGGFMMEPYYFFQDCRQTHKIPIVMCSETISLHLYINVLSNPSKIDSLVCQWTAEHAYFPYLIHTC